MTWPAPYECGPTPFSGRRVADGLVAMSMDTEAALREYLRTVAKVPTIGRIGPVARAFDFVATAAPGIREILTVGKLCFEVREGHYDLVVVDAASTGNVVGQLAAPTGINELIRVGVVRSQTDWILEILGDPDRTGAVLVTTPEEMPVTEAVDLAGRLSTETPVHLACVVANRVLPELFGRSEEQIFNELVWPARLDLLARELDTSPRGRGGRARSGATRGDRTTGRRCPPRATAGSHSCGSSLVVPAVPLCAVARVACGSAGRPCALGGARHVSESRRQPERGVAPAPSRAAQRTPTSRGSGGSGRSARAGSVVDPEQTRHLEQLLSAKEIVVACGPGGVGKTTTSAALAATAAARLGGRVLVLTVDPARRLADALGVGGLGNVAETRAGRGILRSRRTPEG